jgi:hypothetical protein
VSAAAVAGAVGLLLALDAPPAVAAPTADPIGMTVGAPPAAGADQAAEAAALQLAARSGKPVEVVGAKTETQRKLATPHGTLIYEQYAVPQWTKSADSRWRPIDLSLRRNGSRVAPVASSADVHFSAGGTEPLAALNAPGGVVRLSWPSALPEPRIDGETATYESVLPDVDLQVHATVDGFGYSLVVKTRAAAANPALQRLRFGLSATGLTLQDRRGGGFEARDGAGKVAVAAGQALMWDASGVPGNQRAMTAAARSKLAREVPDLSRKAALPTVVDGGGLVITPDTTLLSDPATQFPVVIDPSTTVGKVRWGYANSGNENRDDGIVRVGRNPDGSGNYRSYFAFNLTWLAGKQVRGAKFHTVMTHSYSCVDSPINLYRTAELTSAGRQAWSGPGLALFMEQRSGHAHKPSTGEGCADDPQPNRYMEFATPTLKNDIISYGTSTGNYTLALSTRDSNGANEGDTSRWAKFDQGQTFLSVEYNTPPSTPAAAALTSHTDYTAAGLACVTGAGRPIVRSATPWLKATISDPDGANGGQLSGSFALQRYDGTAWTNVAGWPKSDGGVPSGTRAEVQIPSGTLTSGIMRWQVQVSDTLGGSSAWSTWCEFDYDTTPPGVVPTVTSTDNVYPQTPPNDVLSGGVGRSARFTFGAGGVPDVVDYEYQLDGGAKMYATATAVGGTATVWITPTHVGENVLTVRSRDAAQNASPPMDYRFLVNVPSAPVATWKLDEGSGTTLATTTGGPAATLINGPTWTDGRVLGTHAVAGADRAVTFDGTNDHAATAGPVLDTSKSFSAATWTRLTAASTTWRPVLCQTGSRMCAFALSYSAAPTNRWVMDMYSGDVDNAVIDRVTSPAPPVIGQWTHLAMSWDAGTKTAKFYVNGALAGAIAHASNWNAAGPLQFAQGRYNGTTHVFVGDIGEVRVWDRVVDPDTDVKPLVAPVLAGAWEMEDFDEVAPRQVTDDSGYQRPLTLTGPATSSWCDGYNLTGGLCFNASIGSATTTGPVLRTDQAYTVSAWLRSDGAAGTHTALSQESTAVSAFFVSCRTATPRWTLVTVNGTDDTTSTAIGTPQCTADVWTHVVGVVDPTAAQMRLYIDGVLAATAPTVATLRTAPSMFAVGRGRWDSQTQNPVDFWGGGIDRVRVWQGVLTDSQITALSQEA